MITGNSPLEMLAAFAIVFAAGVLSTIALAKYAQSMKSNTDHAARSS